MIERGKFRALTLVNWNGFFVRTFDLDNLVTTLSGGNGAGKSTTMAAFVTALIPDLTLLHFRNTTDAGATHGARDKGLYGKLQPGLCYTILDVINSRQQRILIGVRLQQIAGREHKIDLKLFMLQDLPDTLTLTELFTETLAGSQVRVRSLPSIKTVAESLPGVLFKSFNALIDYHAALFDLGIIPKRLSTAADRSKFYRLMEASLYGGISGAITRSLRDYLLPDNSGVRKAFQDMEAALRENRLTLAAIKLTQTDRDLFKTLLTQATTYVAADYMRHANQRKADLHSALALRQSMLEQRQQLAQWHDEQSNILQQLANNKRTEVEVETECQCVQQQLHQLNAALQQHAKIVRYQQALVPLSQELQLHTQQLIETEKQLAEAERESERWEHDLDQLKNQLADQKLALDTQQTRTIQYQQAQQALEKARTLCQLPDLQPETALQWQHTFETRAQKVTQHLLALTQKLHMAQTATTQFEQAHQLVCQIAGPVEAEQAWQKACELLQAWLRQQQLIDTLPLLQSQQRELTQRLQQQQAAQRLLTSYQQHSITDSDQQKVTTALADLTTTEGLIAEQQAQEARNTALAEAWSATHTHCTQLRQHIDQMDALLNQHQARVTPWLAAQRALQQLRQQCQQPLTDSHQVSQEMQQALADQQQITSTRHALTLRKNALVQQIDQLQQPGGSADHRLVTLAEQLGGTLLTEIYDDITFDEAAYFSALYGPARHAIVVPELARACKQIAQLAIDLDDLYLIEGEAHAFDDALFNANQQGKAVLVQISDRQLRYSPFPSIPLLGHTAREQQLEKLRAERDQLEQQYTALSFELQKQQRLCQGLSEFISHSLTTAFEPDPEQQITQLMQQRQQQRQQQAALQQINQLLPSLPLLAEQKLAEQVSVQQEAVRTAQEAQRLLQQQAPLLAQLEPLLPILRLIPTQQMFYQDDCQQAEQAQLSLREQAFALAEVVQRQAHFNYQVGVSPTDDLPRLNQQLQQQLTHCERARQQARERRQQCQQQHIQSTQTLSSLQSTYNAKQELLQELQQELAVLKIPYSKEVQLEIQQRCEALQKIVNDHRSAHSHLERQLACCEAQRGQAQAQLAQRTHHYHQKRLQVITAKRNWRQVLQLALDHQIAHRLHQREYAYHSADTLRSLSDKTLGALRQTVADHAALRDALRLSEDPKSPTHKVRFYLAVYHHLQQRIRQDIIRSDDPIEAIEHMEIELARLTEELTAREDKLTISAKSVANIIRKTIQREQNRIHLLNQGLHSISFGQVQGVRLKVDLRDSHALLLKALSEQQEQHQDLFTDRQLSFSEALTKLYQRLVPQADNGQRFTHNLGDALLDYRHYLTLTVEVSRGTEGWLRAESNVLSTGEAIGTGMAILVMVIQSWETEASRLRAKDICPCRLLFLDEAARLDGKSINTLFELCKRLQMQLLIAAPENINPEQGTTYKLVRKLFQNKEHVHVIGLRGFAEPILEENRQQAL